MGETFPGRGRTCPSLESLWKEFRDYESVWLPQGRSGRGSRLDTTDFAIILSTLESH